MIKLFKKTIALTLAISITSQCFFQQKLFALSGGPQSPEFSNFESVSTSNMVDPFTGDFTYNLHLLEVPGPNGGGYPLSLSYHSGVTPEEEASWVGYGWTLNPGAIIRNKKGFADDLYNADVKYYNKVPVNRTVSLTATSDASIRAFGLPSEFLNTDAGISNVLSYNNYKGISLQTIPYVSYQLGLKNTNISVEPGESLSEGARYSYSYTNPMMFMISMSASTFGGIYNVSSNIEKCTANLFNYMSKSIKNNSSISSSRLSAYSLHNNSFPASLSEYTGVSYTLSCGGYAAPAPIPIGIGVTIAGSYLTQNATDTKIRKGYGYLYSDIANENYIEENSDNTVAMDYSVEKEEDFNLRDEILPIPYSSADDFTVVGEGISGVMRLYSAAPGEFFPAYTHSHTSIGSIGVHLTTLAVEAATYDVGVQTGTEEGQNISVGKWDDNGENNAYKFINGGPEKYYFRFKGDMGGSVSYTDADAVEYASINQSEDIYRMSSNIYTNVNNDIEHAHPVDRSTFVGYHTNEEMAYEDGAGVEYNKYSSRSDIENLTDRTSNASDDDETNNNLSKSIGEFEVTNKQGIRYVYGLPMYAKNEKQISFSVNDQSTDSHIVYAAEDPTSSDEPDRKFGHIVKDRYAASFLLTEVTTPNFIDVDHNGPDEGDFGGWTKFNYTKTYGENGSNATYYHWRNPYRGLNYNPGEYSNPDDDLGSYESGDREVAYVSSIETATHIAIFELNTDQRHDGLSAKEDDLADNDQNAQGSQRLRYLKTIKLYAKNEDGNQGELIKTVHFEYDYSLMQNQLNSDGASGSSGKLTLTKIWFEYANVHNSGISPYIFEYAYPSINPDDDNSISYPSPFGNATDDTLNIVELYSQYTADQQNPNYNADNTDVWGMYQNNGSDHFSNYFPWVDQTPETDFSNQAIKFDPAAWHLKRIKLPTGAEIHVQYEQKDYSYVQNRKAMAMASVTAVVDHEGYAMGSGSYGAKYYLTKLDALGISSADTASLADYIQELFIKKGQKMYFKFKYDISTICNTKEYISGYANVMAVGAENNTNSSHYGDFYIQLGNPRFSEGNGSPCEACQEYNKANKGLLIMNSNDCDNTLSNDDNDPKSNILQLWGLKTNPDSYNQSCKSMNVQGESYLKIPLPNAKKGGGVRVKRLITYDPGIENDHADKRVYGNEYVYQTEDGESSGIAANEPNREENALIGYLQKRSESTDDQILVSGEDKKQFEGPIGEYLLPGPTIGYSRIVTKNIYSGTTNNGFSVNTFYTAKDYPFDWGNPNDTYCGVKHSDVDQKKEEANKFGFFINKVLADYMQTQGYRFVIPNMHGKPRASMQYDGKYADINNPTACTLLTSTEYNYFEPGEEIPVMNNYTSDGPQYGQKQLGKETEIVCYSKKVAETVEQSHTSAEGGIMFWVPFEIPYVIPIYMRTVDDSYMKMHVTNQIIYFPPVLKSITNYIDGTYKTISNKYFDAKTGDVLVQETSGNYDQLVFDNNATHEGKYTTYSLPAHFFYEGMGQKSGSEGFTFSSGTGGATLTKYAYGSNYSLFFTGSGYNDIINNFSEGDFIALNTIGSNSKEIYNITSVSPSIIILSPVSGFHSSDDSNGQEVEVTIIKSGKANLLTTMAGNLTTYGNSSGVLNASAATFSDQWAMDDELKSTYGAYATNPIATGEAGKWHLQNTYSFWDDVTRMDNHDVVKVYDAGILKNFSAFNWANTADISSKWKNISTATTYTPNGNTCEEKNLYNIYSTNKMGYGGSLVYLAAQNAEYASTLFESFEYNGGEEIIDNAGNSVSEDVAHSGNHSLNIFTSTNTSNAGGLTIINGNWGYFNLFSSRERTDQERDKGLSVKMWVKTGDDTPTFTLRDASAYDGDAQNSNGSLELSGTQNFTETQFDSIARSGEWTLYEAKIRPSAWADYSLFEAFHLVTNFGFQVYVETNNVMSTPSIYVDDVRMQPLDAQMACYVYDPSTYKTIASFDDQHFGLFYQYNDEGQLIRKQKETVKGLKTVVETQYNTPTTGR